ncbi:MAG: DUF433 domain-containing protein, partial [Oxalobacteraceae bacterium]
MSTAVLETEKLISSLSRAEKTQVLLLIMKDLSVLEDESHDIISRFLLAGIDRRADGTAYIVRTRIPVWLLEQTHRLGASDADILRAYPSLRAADLVTAWSYASACKTEIDEAIIQNDAD